MRILLRLPLQMQNGCISCNYCWISKSFASMQFSLKQNDVFVLLVPCAPGMYMVSSQCVPCPEGHYQPLPGQLTCEPCTENRTVVDSGTNCTGKNKLRNSNMSFKEKMEPSIDLYFYSLLFSFSKFIIMLLFY